MSFTHFLPNSTSSPFPVHFQSTSSPIPISSPPPIYQISSIKLKLIRGDFNKDVLIAQQGGYLSNDSLDQAHYSVFKSRYCTLFSFPNCSRNAVRHPFSQFWTLGVFNILPIKMYGLGAANRPIKRQIPTTLSDWDLPTVVASKREITLCLYHAWGENMCYRISLRNPNGMPPKISIRQIYVYSISLEAYMYICTTLREIGNILKVYFYYWRFLTAGSTYFLGIHEVHDYWLICLD